MAGNGIMTSGGLALIRDFLAQDDPGLTPTPPQFIAISSGVAIVGRFWWNLPGETFRAPIIGRDANGNTITYHAFLDITQNSNQTIGAFALVGGNATPQAGGSGTYIAVANEPFPFPKNETATLSIDFPITISGALV